MLLELRYRGACTLPGESRARIGGATWKRLDRATGEVWVGSRNRALAHLFVYLRHLSSKE